ncbi:MAG: hypothetical protein ILNGONEN_02311 [Syntrophorhabdaceae bacterium]|nr:hypothetical protein [Syntrophorhabdaceae bacterium]
MATALITSFSPGHRPPQVTIPQPKDEGSKNIFFLAPATSMAGNSLPMSIYFLTSSRLSWYNTRWASLTNLTPSRGEGILHSPSRSIVKSNAVSSIEHAPMLF